jgi:hypothetical protein
MVVFKDINTPSPFVEDFSKYGDDGERGKSALPDHIYMVFRLSSIINFETLKNVNCLSLGRNGFWYGLLLPAADFSGL